jgi:hypothetical protein
MMNKQNKKRSKELSNYVFSLLKKKELPAVLLYLFPIFFRAKILGSAMMLRLEAETLDTGLESRARSA